VLSTAQTFNGAANGNLGRCDPGELMNEFDLVALALTALSIIVGALFAAIGARWGWWKR
jgi:hypothetical protein